MEGVVDLQQEKHGDVLILRLKGRLDAVSASPTEKKVFDCISEGKSKLLLDMSGVAYLSSAGMRMLLSTTKKIKSLDGKLVLCSITQNVMDVLKMSGFDHVLDIVETEDLALRKFSVI